jgi:hypothetical protein
MMLFEQSSMSRLDRKHSNATQGSACYDLRSRQILASPFIRFGEISVSKLTVYLARLIGPFALLVGIGCLVRGNAVIESTVANGPIMLVYALVSVGAGLAMVLGHNVWSGGMLPVAVTLVGWLILAKGLLLFFVTPEVLTQVLERMQYGEHYSLYVAPSLVIGLYLTWAGFTTAASK